MRELRLSFLGVLSIQKESDHRGFFDSFLLASKCRITVVLSFWRLYRLAATNYKFGADGRLWIDPIKSRESG